MTGEELRRRFNDRPAHVDPRPPGIRQQAVQHLGHTATNSGRVHAGTFASDAVKADGLTLDP